MYCPNCGKKVEDGSKFCYNCGASIEAPQTQKNADRISDNQKAISDRPQTVPAENNGAKASEEENGKKENPIITGIRIVVAVIFMVLVIGLFTGRFDDFFARITNGSMADNTSKVVVDKNTGNVYSTAQRQKLLSGRILQIRTAVLKRLKRVLILTHTDRFSTGLAMMNGALISCGI